MRNDWKCTMPQAMPAGTSHFFSCPTCTHVESSWCSAFQCKDLDNQLLCNGCHKKYKVSLWKCQCNKLWHRCSLHRSSPEGRSIHRTKLKTSKQIFDEAGNRKRARFVKQIGPDSHEWLLAEDRAAEKRKRDFVDGYGDQATIVLGFPTTRTLKSNFLGPRLKRRFLEGRSPEVTELQ